jgi:hypothetical protein
MSVDDARRQQGDGGGSREQPWGSGATRSSIRSGVHCDVLLLALVEALRRRRSVPVVRGGSGGVGGMGLLTDGGGGGCSHGMRVADLRGIRWNVDIRSLTGRGAELLRGAHGWGEGSLHFRRAGVLNGRAALGVLKGGG